MREVGEPPAMRWFDYAFGALLAVLFLAWLVSA